MKQSRSSKHPKFVRCLFSFSTLIIVAVSGLIQLSLRLLGFTCCPIYPNINSNNHWTSCHLRIAVFHFLS